MKAAPKVVRHVKGSEIPKSWQEDISPTQNYTVIITTEERRENGFTPEQEAEIIRETEEALRHGKSYNSAEEMHREILGS